MFGIFHRKRYIPPIQSMPTTAEAASLQVKFQLCSAVADWLNVSLPGAKLTGHWSEGDSSEFVL